MNNLARRLDRIETRFAPQRPGRTWFVWQDQGETSEQAILKSGIDRQPGDQVMVFSWAWSERQPVKPSPSSVEGSFSDLLERIDGKSRSLPNGRGAL